MFVIAKLLLSIYKIMLNILYRVLLSNYDFFWLALWPGNEIHSPMCGSKYSVIIRVRVTKRL